MRKEDEMLLIADELHAIGIQNMITELHDTRMRDLAMYKEKVYQARGKYAEMRSRYKTEVSRNQELTDKLSTKFDNI